MTPTDTSRAPRAGLPAELANLTDEQISTLTQEIQDSFTRDTPLIGPLLPISVLLDEFRENEPFVRKLSSLGEKWDGFRRTQRNGNCFYLAFAYGWLEGLETLGKEGITAAVRKVEESATTFEAAGHLNRGIVLM
jgi:ubiquitin thioesterase protein OTUB1